MTETLPCLSTLRRAAHARGLRLVKIREDSRDYYQYGPYVLCDLHTTGIVCSGLELADIADELARW